MSVALLDESPFSSPEELGPYRIEDYAAQPDTPRCELLRGRFYLTPSPAPPHQMAAFLLARHLDQYAEPRGDQVFLAPLDVQLGDHTVVQPDVIYISQDRRAICQERIVGAPDLLIEVLSPGTARRDHGEKLSLYAEFDVREYWLVDPAERRIEFLINERWRFVVALPMGKNYRTTTLPGFTLDIDDFWQRVNRRLGR